MIITKKNYSFKKHNQSNFILKKAITIIIILCFFTIYSFPLNKFKLKIKPFKENKNKALTNFSDFNKLLFSEKRNLLGFITKNAGKNITLVKSIYLGKKYRFGNQLIIIYKTIFYCQILGCKKIFLESNYNWYIRNKIINKKYKMIIESKNIKNINKYDIIIDKTHNFFYYSKYIKPTFRINLLRKELIKNLKKISISHKDLFIYIRSGDIFIKPHPLYRQPPLCFYKNVIVNYLFKNIYLISENKNNPVINELLKEYPNIIYNFNSLKNDISYLVNAYNIIGGASSTFLHRMMELNNNLHFLWTFGFKSYPFSQKLKFKITNFYNIHEMKIFLMYASNYYIHKMLIWKNTQEQRDLMINEICPNPFVLIN